MGKSKLDQALIDLIEAYTALESEIDTKYADDEESYAAAMIEALETSVEAAIEDQDASTSSFASLLSSLTEALEQLDPSAFEGGEDEDDESDYDSDEDDVDLDDDDLDDEDDDDEDDDD